MQIYKYMNIGTAKATDEEQRAVPHHMIDFLLPSESFSVEEYRARALRAAEEITSRGKLPIFVGGTGLYIDALTRASMENVPESSPEYREAILDSIRGDGDIDRLWQRLYEVDRESAEKIHKNNVRRVIRALEIYDTTGKTKSYFDSLSREKSRDITVGMITLDFHNRDNLYERIDRRVELMMEEGLLREARYLYDNGYLSTDTTASQAIGYKELGSYFDGEQSLDEAVKLIKQSSRRYAKRQLTWFRHEECAVRVFIDGENGIMRSTEEILNEILNATEKYKKDFGLL
jgi:tRNA dimethylallyltransferase